MVPWLLLVLGAVHVRSTKRGYGHALVGLRADGCLPLSSPAPLCLTARRTRVQTAPAFPICGHAVGPEAVGLR